MLLWPLRKMKKTVFCLLPKLIPMLILLSIVVGFSACRTKIAPYPTGIIFPLAVDQEIQYLGEIIDVMRKQGENLIFSTRNGLVYALNSSTRKVAWQFPCHANLESPPFLGKEHIYIYDQKGTLYCLGSEGRLLWEKKLEGQISSGVLESGGILYLGTVSGLFLALQAVDGQEAWRFQAGGAVRSTPVVISRQIVFGCDDHYLYFLNWKGSLVNRFQTGGEIRGSLGVNEGLLYFGSYDHYFYCWNMAKKKLKWKVKTGGSIHTHPVIHEKKLFFISMSNVLYCLHKKTGTILWWQAIPARSYYLPEIIEDKIVVSALSPEFVCFEIETGRRIGQHEAGDEVKTNPAWVDPYLIINQYRKGDDSGRLVFLKKNVGVSMSASKTSPQKVNEEIVLSVSTSGFHLPQYEFKLKHFYKIRFFFSFTIYIESSADAVIVQDRSENSSWIWFPDKTGFYIITVDVKDEKEKAEAKIIFTIKGTSGK